jgi:hypothetical protein
MKRASEQDLRPMARESAAHHEECLEAALEDIQRHSSPPIPNYDPEAAFGWAVTHAQKHYEALRALPGYVMPDWLSTMYADAMGEE